MVLLCSILDIYPRYCAFPPSMMQASTSISIEGEGLMEDRHLVIGSDGYPFPSRFSEHTINRSTYHRYCLGNCLLNEIIDEFIIIAMVRFNDTAFTSYSSKPRAFQLLRKIQEYTLNSRVHSPTCSLKHCLGDDHVNAVM